MEGLLTGSKGGRLGLPQLIQRRPILGHCTWLLGDIGICITKSLGPKIPYLVVKANCKLKQLKKNSFLKCDNTGRGKEIQRHFAKYLSLPA